MHLAGRQPALGYTPSATDAIRIINYAGASLTGTFNGLPDGAVAYANVLGSGVDYRIFYGTLEPNVVMFVPVPEPSIALALAAVGVVVARTGRRRPPAAAHA